jgi:hypothetical protein
VRWGNTCTHFQHTRTHTLRHKHTLPLSQTHTHTHIEYCFSLSNTNSLHLTQALNERPFFTSEKKYVFGTRAAALDVVVTCTTPQQRLLFTTFFFQSEADHAVCYD